MTFTTGLIIFAALTLILWWAMQNQLDVGAQAHLHGGHEAHAATAATHIESDDLTRIEGIGPKINAELHNAGIHTFADLAAATP